jgi:hypothetical protein
MVNIFQTVAEKLIQTGFLDALIFMITAAIFYGLFRKTKILGESVVINGVLALAIAFFIFVFPAMFGVSLILPVTRFFGGALVWILIFLIGFLLAGFFYPDLGKMLAETFTRRTALTIMIIIGITLFITSGLITVFTGGWAPSPPGEGAAGPGIPTDIIILAAGLIIFIVLIIIASAILRGM